MCVCVCVCVYGKSAVISSNFCAKNLAQKALIFVFVFLHFLINRRLHDRLKILRDSQTTTFL